MIERRGRTNLGYFLELNGELYEVEPPQPEESNPGYGYRVEVIRFTDEDLRRRMDAARATVFPNSTTPPQRAERGGIIDYPIRGSGILLYLRPDGCLQRITYDEENEAQRNLGITYEKGSYICWIAGDLGLEFIEVCEPPYQPGGFTDLDIDSDDVPETFRQAFRSLTEA